MLSTPFRKASAVVGVGAVTFASVRMMSTPAASKCETLSSSAFNAIQDKAIIAAYNSRLEAFATSSSNPLHVFHQQYLSSLKAGKNLPTTSEAQLEDGRKNAIAPVYLYELLSCPYCSKVKAVLDYHGVPYQSTIVDPLSMQPLPPHSDQYPLVPQLKIPTSPMSDTWSYIVDSGDIVEALAGPLGFSKQLVDPRVKSTRDWISETYIRSTFVAMCGTWSSAYEAYPNFVRQNSFYQYTPARWIGSTALTWMCSMRVKKMKSDGTLGKDEAFDAFIYRQFNDFVSKFPSNESPFHGGNTPDIADIEMFGVTRAVIENSQLQAIFKDGGKVEVWINHMNALAPRYPQHTK